MNISKCVVKASYIFSFTSTFNISDMYLCCYKLVLTIILFSFHCFICEKYPVVLLVPLISYFKLTILGIEAHAFQYDQFSSLHST